MSLGAVLKGSAGFRVTHSVFSAVRKAFNWFVTPAHTTIRTWLLKLGLFKLNRSKDLSKEWALIVDSSIQMGAKKCLLVLGIPLSNLKGNFCPNFEQVEPLVIKTLTSTKGETVRDALLEAAQKVGNVSAVISDEGSDMKKGVRLSIEDNPGQVGLIDIVHKNNSLLKNELKKDIKWRLFSEAATKTIQKLKLSPLAHLVPPRQRAKGRLLSQIHLVEWGTRLLSYLKSDQWVQLDSKHRDKIEWIKKFEKDLVVYQRLMEICKSTIGLVHERGYFQGVAEELKKTIKVQPSEDIRIRRFVGRLAEFLHEQGHKIPPGKAYPGSSEVIESVFGKFKHMEGHHASSGLTSLVLSIPALLGPTSEAIVEQALSMVRIGDVEKWVKSNLSRTYLSERRKCLV